MATDPASGQGEQADRDADNAAPRTTEPDRPAKPTCRTCGQSVSRVIDSRPAVREQGIRRKRKCVCGAVFFTLERFERIAS